MRPPPRLVALAAFALAACEAEPAPQPPDEPRPSAAPSEPPATIAAPAPPPPRPAPADEPAPAAASTPPAAAPWSPRGYRLVGTEPFWGGTVAGRRILYQTPEDEAGAAVAVTPGYGPARETYSGTLAGRPFVLTLSKGPCSDGMSDNVHAFTAELLVAGETRRGCANPN